MKDYYYLLGINRDLPKDEIKKVYYKLSKKFHPDLNEGSREFEAQFRNIKEAYETLMDDNKRSVYNKNLFDYEKRTRNEESQKTKPAPNTTSKSEEPKPGTKRRWKDKTKPSDPTGSIDFFFRNWTIYGRINLLFYLNFVGIMVAHFMGVRVEDSYTMPSLALLMLGPPVVWVIKRILN